MKAPAAILLVLGVAAAKEARADDALPSAVRGVSLQGSFETSHAGDAIMGELGAETSGLRAVSADRGWLLAWEARGAVRAGVLANQHPFFGVAGVRARASAELGRRLLADRAVSPYVGARLASEAMLMANPGLSANALDAVSDMDGALGVVAKGSARLGAGVSVLAGRTSLVAELFAQEAMQGRQAHTPGLAFTQVGLALRLDVWRALTAVIEGAWGPSLDRATPALGLVDARARANASGVLRWRFGNGMWLAASASWQRDTDRLRYAGGASYDTGEAPDFALALAFGAPLWGSR